MNQPWHKYYDYNVPVTIRYPEVPVQTWLYLTASQYPDKPAIDFLGTEISFWQIREQMLRLANALGRLGVKKGDRIAIALPNCPQYVISFYAALSLGAIVVNINPMYTHGELKFMLENTGTQTLITSDSALPTMRILASELGIRLIATGVMDYRKGASVTTAKSLDLEKGCHHFSEMIDGCTVTSIPRVTVTSSDPALIQFTGGTTGLPKGALLSHSNINATLFQCDQWGNAINTRQAPGTRKYLSVIPYFHIYGNVLCMNGAVLTCATQIMMPRFDLDVLLETIGRFDSISFFPTVPTMITAILNHPKAPGIGLGKRIKLINSGGAPMPTELIDQARDAGLFFGEGWGMSETTSAGISNPNLRTKTGSIGIPLPDVQVRLVDLENGTEDVKPGDPGEIILRGPNVMREYWNNPEETDRQFKDGWIYTGDIAQQDEDGYMFIVDRKKDMIIAGGFNIYPREIDEVLYSHPQISEAIAFGIPDAYRGETVKACVVLKRGATASEKEILNFCKEKLAPYKIPKFVEFREELPKSAAGKILRKTLRDEEAALKK